MTHSATSEAPVSPQVAWDRFDRSPAPDWVEPIEAPTQTVGDAGISWLLLDEQTRFSPERARYRRVVQRAENESGVDWLSEIRITFNPSFERLSLHGVVLDRGGSLMDALEDADIDFMRVEHDMHARVYRGDYVVIIQIRGVDPGDVIDFSFTITGRNPVFDGRDVLDIPFGFDFPVGRHRVRLIDPQGAGQHLFRTGPDVVSHLHQGPTGPETIVDRSELARHDFEACVPAEFDDQVSRWLVSGFPDWNAVAVWSADLYRIDPDDAAVAAVVTALPGDTPADRVQAAIAFVQDRIRYVATNFGEGGYRPRPPSVILKRRYGDCKDKALLLTALLRRLQVRAGPALVSMYRPGGALSDPPSPGSFDHVVVRAVIDGDEHWIDATARGQVGPLAARSGPRDGAALIIDPTTTEPVRLPPSAADRSGNFSDGVIDLRGGPGRPVLMSYVNRSEGAEAEMMRQWIASAGAESLAQEYLDHMSESQGQVERAGPFEIEDDAETNTLTIRNTLRLLDPWAASGSGMLFRYMICNATILPQGVSASRRQRPLNVTSHPLHHRHVETILLPPGPRPQGLATGVTTLANAAFDLSRTARFEAARSYVIAIETRTRGPSIAAGDIVKAQRDETALRHAHELALIFPRRKRWFG